MNTPEIPETQVESPKTQLIPETLLERPETLEHQKHNTETTRDTRLMIWILTAGSYIIYNDLCSKGCLGQKAIYNTEILVWKEVPAKSVICRWPRSEIYHSGLLDIFPSLSKLKPGMRLDDLRCRMRDDFPSFSSTKVASALVYLDMEPSHFQIKQVFIFLLGQAVGYSIEKTLGNIKAQLEATLPPVIEEFEQASHN